MDISKIDELVEILGSSRSTEILVRKGQDSIHIVRSAKPRTQPAAPVLSAEPVSTSAATEPEVASIRSTKVGIFHSGAGAPEVGNKVYLGQPLGVIESMKIFNEILAEVTGVVLDVLVEDGSPVEYGQELYRIEKA